MDITIRNEHVGETISIPDSLLSKPTPAPEPDPAPRAETIFLYDGNVKAPVFEDHVKDPSWFNFVEDWYQSRANRWANGIDSAIGRMLFPIYWMAPLSVYKAVESTSWPSWPNSHSQVRLANRDTEYFENAWWTKDDVAYTWTCRFVIPQADWSGWCLLMQGHPGSYGQDWADPRSRPPSFGLYIINGKMRLHVKGSDEQNPTRYNEQAASDVMAIKFDEEMEFTIVFRPSIRGWLALYLNGQEQFSAGQPIGLNFSSLGYGKRSLNLACGFYGTRNEAVIEMPYCKLTAEAV